MMMRLGSTTIALMLCLGPPTLEAQQRDGDEPARQRLQRVDPQRSENAAQPELRRPQRSAEERDGRAGRTFEPPTGRDEQMRGQRRGEAPQFRSPRERSGEEPWFDPDWWYESPGDSPRRPPRDGDRDEPWFDPGWWHEWPDDGRRRPPRDGDRDEPWFDPGWWHEWPDDGRRPPDFAPPPDRYRGVPRQGPGFGYDRAPRRGGDRIPARPPRAVLGVSLRDAASGPRVDSLVQEGPAAQAGVRPGDVLVAIDDRRVSDTADVRRLLRRYRPGQEVHLHYERGDRLRRTSAVLEPRREVY